MNINRGTLRTWRNDAWKQGNFMEIKKVLDEWDHWVSFLNFLYISFHTMHAEHRWRARRTNADVLCRCAAGVQGELR
jgi:hypothetical protein